jgi:hypothetical protein
MLELLNTRIKEMLGEQMQKLRDKIDALTEGKKGFKVAKHPRAAKGAKPDFLDLDHDGNTTEPMKKAAKDAKVKENFDGDRNADQDTPSKYNKKKTSTGTTYTKKSKEFDKDSSDDGKKDTSHLQGMLGGAPKNAAKGRVHKMKEGAKHPAGCDCKECTMQENAEFGSYYDEKVAQKVFDQNPNLDTSGRADEFFKLAWPIMVADLGERSARSKINSEDFPSDAVSAYSWLQRGKTGMGEGKLAQAAKTVKKGALHKQEHIPADKKIGDKKLKSLKAHGTPLEKKRANFALNIQGKGTKSKKDESVYRHNVRFVNESLQFLLMEDEEAKAKTITAASDIVNDYTSWMQRVGQYQTKALIELADSIRAEFGQAEAETFKQTVAPALSQTLEVLTQQRESISNAVAALAGGAAPEEPMGMEPGLDASAPDDMNPGGDIGGDEFGASDAAAGGPEVAGRGLRESRGQRRARKLAEAHSIMSKLAK